MRIKKRRNLFSSFGSLVGLIERSSFFASLTSVTIKFEEGGNSLDFNNLLEVYSK